MFKKLLFLMTFFFLVGSTFAQKPVNIQLVGTVQGFINKDRLIGVTIYLMQNDRTINKTFTDNYGNYTITGIINPQEDIDLLISKPGFVPKKVLFDLKTLKISRPNQTTLQLLEDLTVELYDQKQGVDLSFARIGYAEKFYWDQPSFTVKPDEKQKKDLDEKVKKAYEANKNAATTATYQNKAKQALDRKEYQKAVQYYDTALVMVPRDSITTVRRNEVVKIIEDLKKEEDNKKEFDRLKTAGDLAFADKKWNDAETNYLGAQKITPTDTYVKSQIGKIAAERQKEQESAKNKSAYDKAISDAVALVVKKSYNEAIEKYKFALTLQPEKKEFIDGEILKVKNKMADTALEVVVLKELKTAAEFLNKNKLDDAITQYKATEKTITGFTDPNLVTKYSKEINDGLQKVRDKKNSEEETYQSQLTKAQENYNKGRNFYSVAKTILNSDPMKSKSTVPQVVELKEKITKMEAYYSERDKTYQTVAAKKDNESIEQLTVLLNNSVFQQKIASTNEKAQLQKSIDSLKALKPVVAVTPPKNTPPPTPPTTKLAAPGELVAGPEPQSVFNDLYETFEKRKAQPLDQQQGYKDRIEFERQYEAALVATRQEEEKTRLYNFKDNKDVLARQVGNELEKNQYELENRKLLTEIAAEKRDVEARLDQAKTADIITSWKDKTDYHNIIYQEEIAKQYQAQVKSIDKNKDENEMKARQINSDEEVRQAQIEKGVEKLNYARYKQDSLAKTEQEVRGYQIQKMMDYKSEIVASENNLTDENGVPFERNKMTEKVYQIKNSAGEVITVIVRRVVVDNNGHGVVFEQITSDSGRTHYTRNGAPVPDFVWFNDSTGINVIQR